MIGTAFCAEEYDDKIKRTLPFYEQFYEQIADVLEVSGKKDVSWLDIGCGTGKVYETVRRRVPVEEFTFTDISEKMLDIARSRFPAEGNRFKQMSVLELEDKEKYDVVTAIQVYHYLSERDRESAVMKCWQALYSDCSVMKLNDFFGQRKSKPISFRGMGSVSLIKFVKNIRLCFFIHTKCHS